MPPGVPVATMAINGAKNAGIFACSILAIHSNNLSLKIKKFKKQMEQISISKDKTLNTLGFKSYQKEKDDQENIIHPN
jgi:5-(carboxyamino)imidazole ribonucleotide mutase